MFTDLRGSVYLNLDFLLKKQPWLFAVKGVWHEDDDVAFGLPVTAELLGREVDCRPITGVSPNPASLQRVFLRLTPYLHSLQGSVREVNVTESRSLAKVLAPEIKRLIAPDMTVSAIAVSEPAAAGRLYQTTVLLAGTKGSESLADMICRVAEEEAKQPHHINVGVVGQVS